MERLLVAPTHTAKCLCARFAWSLPTGHFDLPLIGVDGEEAGDGGLLHQVNHKVVAIDDICDL